jgi:hypothetical protein
MNDVLMPIFDSENVHIRLALTRADTVEWKLRNLVIDVFPTSWISDFSSLDTAYYPPSWKLLDRYATFVAGFYPSELVQAWFRRPEDCRITGVDVNLGYEQKPYIFQMPALPEFMMGRSYYSWESDGFQILPWPHTAHNWDLYTLGSQYFPLDSEPLDLKRPYDDFPEARAELIFGNTDKHRRYDLKDSVGIRVVNPNGWIRQVKVSPEHTKFSVSVMGINLRPAQAEMALKGVGIEVDPKAAAQPGVVEFTLQTPPSEFVQFILRGTAGRMDEARFSPTNSPPVVASTPHILLEQAPATLKGQNTAKAQNKSGAGRKRTATVQRRATSKAAAGDVVLDFELVRGTRVYIENVTRQINKTYEVECYDACAVMIRRLVETLLIEAFEAKNVAAHAQLPDGTFMQLNSLIEKALAEGWNLGRNARQELKRLKEDGDRSAHSRRHMALRSDIDNLKRDLRGVVQELLIVAGIHRGGSLIVDVRENP